MQELEHDVMYDPRSETYVFKSVCTPQGLPGRAGFITLGKQNTSVRTTTKAVLTALAHHAIEVGNEPLADTFNNIIDALE